MDWRPYVSTHPGILSGKPTFSGTRLTVQHVLERMADGWGEAELLEQFPVLTPEHLRAALAFAAASLGSEDTVATGAPGEAPR